MEIYDRSLRLHEEFHGKLKVNCKMPINSAADLSLVYTPGVSKACEKVKEDRENLYRYTIKGNCVAVVTNGTSVLGMGNIGAAAGLPVMEGKCALFKRFANIDAFPVCVETEDVDEFINIVKKITPPFGGINLEDIAAPACFEIERRLVNELDIPVFHDDQHGTAIVTLAALINALKVSGKLMESAKIVIVGAGAAGNAIANLLLKYKARNIVVCDSKGIISSNREDIRTSKYKMELAEKTNIEKKSGTIADALLDADVFIGVSSAGILKPEMIKKMNSQPIIFALANPEPEILPVAAKEAGAFIVGTGRSDYENQINNVLAFPSVFRAALDMRINKFTDEMFISAAIALAEMIPNPSPSQILPQIFDGSIVNVVSAALKNATVKI
jgi:malate dehydrogenase (oxaloacetate-decarboxylating)